MEDFEEPRIAQERYHLAVGEAVLEKLMQRPCSVAFELRKPEPGSSSSG